MKTRIYISPPHMSGEEMQLVQETFASNWIAPLGPQVDAFEEEFSAIVGADHAVALNSGTAALHLALRYLGIGPGDEVICSTLTFVASATPLLFLGARPVFIDSDKTSWNMDPSLLVRELEKRERKNRLPKAVILVHLYGQPADIDPIQEACQRYNIPFIEDAAEALGASYRGKAMGSFGNAGVYSFNGNKIITTSGGGMLISQDKALIEKARFWATQAREAAIHYEHADYGYNYRLSNVLAAIGRGQLRVLQDRVAEKRRIFKHYYESLGDLPGIDFMPEPSYGYATRWLTCITVDPALFGVTRSEIMKRLDAENIESRPIWKPLHIQPLFAGCEYVNGDVAEELFQRGLCLPSGTNMTTGDQDRIIALIRSCKQS